MAVGGSSSSVVVSLENHLVDGYTNTCGIDLLFFRTAVLQALARRRDDGRNIMVGDFVMFFGASDPNRTDGKAGVHSSHLVSVNRQATVVQRRKDDHNYYL